MKELPEGTTHHAMCWKDHHECAKARIQRALEWIQWGRKNVTMPNSSSLILEEIELRLTGLS